LAIFASTCRSRTMRRVWRLTKYRKGQASLSLSLSLSLRDDARLTQVNPYSRVMIIMRQRAISSVNRFRGSLRVARVTSGRNPRENRLRDLSGVARSIYAGRRERTKGKPRVYVEYRGQTPSAIFISARIARPVGSTRQIRVA